MPDATTDGWYDDRSATFGDRLAAAREAAGLSEGDLASRVGVEPATLKSWETDTAEPLANKLSVLSGVLDISLPWLLTGQGEGVTPPEEDVAPSDDLDIALAELRSIRHEALRLAERTGVLEKRLRIALKEVQ